jgi:hypothetical protein
MKGITVTEQEHIRASNRVKVSMALTILQDVFVDDSDLYGVSLSELQEITAPLSRAQNKLFNSYELDIET